MVLALTIIGGGIYIGNKLGLITIDHGSNGDHEGTFAPEEQFDAMYDVSDASSIDSLITAWAKNGGAKYSSKNIINVFAPRVDETGKAERADVRDAIILLSLNKRTKTITLVSFLRDCYTYMNINGSERCCKTNHAYFWAVRMHIETTRITTRLRSIIISASISRASRSLLTLSAACPFRLSPMRRIISTAPQRR